MTTKKYPPTKPATQIYPPTEKYILQPSHLPHDQYLTPLSTNYLTTPSNLHHHQPVSPRQGPTELNITSKLSINRRSHGPYPGQFLCHVDPQDTLTTTKPTLKVDKWAIISRPGQATSSRSDIYIVTVSTYFPVYCLLSTQGEGTSITSTPIKSRQKELTDAPPQGPIKH